MKFLQAIGCLFFALSIWACKDAEPERAEVPVAVQPDTSFDAYPGEVKRMIDNSGMGEDFKTFSDASLRIQTLEFDLRKQLASSAQEKAVDSLVTNNAKGAGLYQSMMAVYRMLLALPLSEQDRKRFMSRMAPDEKTWLMTHFDGRSIKEALTVLGKLQNDIALGSAIVAGADTKETRDIILKQDQRLEQ